MNTASQSDLLKAVMERVLPQQVPDAEVLTDSSAFQRFGLSFLPDIVAFSKYHKTLFFIYADSYEAIQQQHSQGMGSWSSAATCHSAIVAAFPSRGAYAASTIELPANTYIWFADEPKHFLFISESPNTSEQLISKRMARRTSV
ncbi:MAG: BsuBI/PstI family type II restriction endonuclease [Flavobacteriales bacterium]